MPYVYRATTRIRASFRHWRHGLVEVSADEGDLIDVTDEATEWAVFGVLLPSGAVERKREAVEDDDPESEED